MSNLEAAARTPQVVYKLNGVTYVPHYRNSAIFVGPGYPTYNTDRYSAAELANAGAINETEFLWARGTHGTVSQANL